MEVEYKEMQKLLKKRHDEVEKLERYQKMTSVICGVSTAIVVFLTIRCLLIIF